MSITLPNIYEGDYRKLIVLPLLLLVVSAFFIPQIKPGVDFKGGSLITVSVSSAVNEEELKAQLATEGLPEAELKQYDTTQGKVLEIGLPLDEKVAKGEELKSEFFSKVDEVSRLESSAFDPTYGTEELKEKYNAGRAELNRIADEIFGLSGYTEKKAADFENTNLLSRKVSEEAGKVSQAYNSKLENILNKYVPVVGEPRFDIVSAALSARFLEKALGVVIISGLLSIVVVFIIFRSFVPSLAVLVGAACDITIALGAMGLFGIPFTLASFAALLMLVGFSLDTDVLLTMRVMKWKEGRARDRAFGALKTGMTMSTTTLAAFVALFVLAYFTRIPIYYQISSVAIAGLIGDMLATWGINAVMILWYAEKREKGKNAVTQ